MHPQGFAVTDRVREEPTELLVAPAPAAVGAQVTASDPGLDSDGRYARLLADDLATGLRDLGTGR